MKNKMKYVVMLLVLILTLSSITVAVSAADYYEKSCGSTYISISNRTNVLYFKNPHGNFQLRIWVTKMGLFIDNRYSISMYDASGTCVWRATNQLDRTYTVGGNVVKIVITTNSSVGVTLNWRKC